MYVICTDFQKAFDEIPHERLVNWSHRACHSCLILPYREGSGVFNLLKFDHTPKKKKEEEESNLVDRIGAARRMQ